MSTEQKEPVLGKLYIVTRTVKKKYEVMATSKEKAKEAAAERGDPHSVTVVKETVKLSKP